MIVSSQRKLDDFLKLPRKCQEMLFECTDFLISQDWLSWIVDDCKSPIESIFYLAINMVQELGEPFEGCHLEITPQYEIGVDGKTYYADFLIEVFSLIGLKEHRVSVIVECDGHGYHKITKQQVQRDNERDLNLKIAGYDVIHFSGTQIYQSPIKCALDVINYMSIKNSSLKMNNKLHEVWGDGKWQNQR